MSTRFPSHLRCLMMLWLVIFGFLLNSTQTTRAHYLNPHTGRFWTMDSFEGTSSNPASLHKYLYCQGNPVINIDLSGHDIGGMMAVSSIIGTIVALNLPSIPTAKQAVGIGQTVGPDVTTAVLNTTLEVENAFTQSGQASKIANYVAAEFVLHLNTIRKDGWDIYKLNELAGGGAPDFGAGSVLGTGGMGKYTVQFAFAGQPLKVYYASSVNYILWGKVFRMLYEFTRNPMSGLPDPTWSEAAAENTAWIRKLCNGDADYRKEAVAFTKLGWEGTVDPSDTALPLTANPKNTGATAALDWKWLGLKNN